VLAQLVEIGSQLFLYRRGAQAMGKRGGLATNEIRALRFHGRDDAAGLADRVGVARQTVNAIEGNKYSPSLEVAFRIARGVRRPAGTGFQYGREE